LDFSNYTSPTAIANAVVKYLSVDLIDSNGTYLIAQAQQFASQYDVSFIREGYPTTGLEVCSLNK
jgi:hypothetical protein